MLGLALSSLVAGCASGPRSAIVAALHRGEITEALARYERLVASDGGDDELLAQLAEGVLLAGTRSDDPALRIAAVRAVREAGRASRALLERVARESAHEARWYALETLSRTGDETARTQLRALWGEEDPAARAFAVWALDPRYDLASLLIALADANSQTRLHAAQRLARASEHAPQSRRALESVARSDPDASVRIAATRALGFHGAEAFDALRERLSDSIVGVRMSAVEAMMRAAPQRSRELLDPIFATPPSAQGIEGARLLLSQYNDTLDHAALAYLLSALRASQPALRAQAATAWASLSPTTDQSVDGSIRRALTDALQHETDRGARFALGRAELGRDDDLAISTLESLQTSSADMVGLQAAALLARFGEGTSQQILRAFLADSNPLLRRTAARALALDAHRPEDLREPLRDADPSVRFTAASAILAETHSRF